MENTIRLYTSGRESDLKAFDNLLKIIHKRSAAHYTSEVINVFENPIAAKQDGVVVTPTVIFRVSQQSYRKVIGNISDPEKIAVLLGLSQGPNQSRYCRKHPHPIVLLQEQGKGPV